MYVGYTNLVTHHPCSWNGFTQVTGNDDIRSTTLFTHDFRTSYCSVPLSPCRPLYTYLPCACLRSIISHIKALNCECLIPISSMADPGTGGRGYEPSYPLSYCVYDFIQWSDTASWVRGGVLTQRCYEAAPLKLGSLGKSCSYPWGHGWSPVTITKRFFVHSESNSRIWL